MKAMVVIDKSFDDSASFAKEWEFGDMKEFMSDEGKYLDELCLTLDDKGISGTYGDMTFENGAATFQLKDGETVLEKVFI
mgnify:CR=1 FL=1